MLAITVAALAAVVGGNEVGSLRIDPLLVAEANAVWEVIATDANPIWPGWDATSTPILFYIPGVEDVLINHPKPPAGFEPYSGGLRFAGGTIHVKQGPTLIDWDGQNTSREVNGVETLVLADTTSNRKMFLRGLLDDPRATEAKLADVSVTDLSGDPYKQMMMIAHEAFHVFQAKSAPNKGANERNVRLYPCLSVNNNVGLALEGKALADCLQAKDSTVARKAVVRWLAIRQDRRAQLAKEVIDYEDGNEFLEGLAMYVEWRLPEVLEGRRPPEALQWAQGFKGFEGLAFLREEKLSMLLKHMRGEVNVNNDPYGTAPVRQRFYSSGMAIAAMLDRLQFDWKSKIFQGNATLTSLAQEALKATPEELKASLAESQNDLERAQLIEAKKTLEAEGQKDTQKMLEAITKGSHTSLVFDYSALGRPPVGLSFTPFGVRAVDDNRTIYTLVPLTASIGKSQFKQSVPSATLEDREDRLFQFQLIETVSPQTLASSLGKPDGFVWKAAPLDLELPGVRLTAPKAEITHDGSSIRVKLVR